MAKAYFSHSASEEDKEVEKLFEAVLKMFGVSVYKIEGGDFLTPPLEKIEDAIKSRVEEIKKELDEKINTLAEYISQVAQSAKSEPKSDAFTEILKLMNQNLIEIMKSQSSATAEQISALTKMWSDLVAKLSEVRSKGNDEILREVLNLYKTRKEMNPFDLLKMALDLIEKRIFHKEKVSQQDVELAKIEAKKDILQKKLELREKELEMKKHMDLEMAKIWKDLIDSLGKELMTRAGGQLSEALTKFLKSAADYYKRKKEGAPAKIPEEELKELSDEELRSLKEVLEQSEERETLQDLISSVEEELERRSKKVEEKIEEVEVKEEEVPTLEAERPSEGELVEESVGAGEQGNIETAEESPSGSEAGSEGEGGSLDIDLEPVHEGSE